MVIRIATPSIMFLGMAGFYLANSGGPVRVHVLSIACLLLGFWFPAVLANTIADRKRKHVLCSAAILGSLLAWDGLGYLVVLKSEPFDILLSSAWVYLLGFLSLAGLVALSAWLSLHVANLIARRYQSVA